MVQLPKHYVVVTYTAAGVSIIQALLVVIISTVLLSLNSRCADTTSTVPADEFINLLKVQYFQDISCLTSIQPYEDVMSAREVYVWLIILLSFSVAWLVVSIGLFIAADEEAVTYFPALSYTWSAVTTAVTIAHIVLGVLFALDFEKFNNELDNYQGFDEMAYRIDLLRFGTFMLMTLSFKGYVLIIVNIAFIITLIVLGNGARKILQVSEHSMISRGPLIAYETSKRTSISFQTQQPFGGTYAIRPQHNSGYTDTEHVTIPSLRDQPLADFSNYSRTFARTDSWHQLPVTEYGGARPFSYLEEPQSPRSLQTSAAPFPSEVGTTWKKDLWEQPPPVPEPDYSPFSGRRLKSALKQ